MKLRSAVPALAAASCGGSGAVSDGGGGTSGNVGGAGNGSAGSANPRATAGMTVLATIDESTYTGGTVGADHPLVWAHATAGGGRAIYTAMGHTMESYADPLFRQHLAGAIHWAAGR